MRGHLQSYIKVHCREGMSVHNLVNLNERSQPVSLKHFLTTTRHQGLSLHHPPSPEIASNSNSSCLNFNVDFCSNTTFGKMGGMVCFLCFIGMAIAFSGDSYFFNITNYQIIYSNNEPFNEHSASSVHSAVSDFNVSDYRDSIHFPLYHTVEDLNDDLFCSLKTNANGMIIDKAYRKLLNHMLTLQYPSDCFSENQRFLIYEQQCNVGLFASLECIAYYWSIALFLNRTFLINGDWTFHSNSCGELYPTNNPMDCFFIPVSNCSVNEVLSNELSRSDPSIFNMTASSLRKREEDLGLRINQQWFRSPAFKVEGLEDRILIMPPVYGWHRLQVGSSINNGLKTYFGLGRMDFVTMTKAYFLRMQPSMKKAVDQKVRDSIQSSISSSSSSSDHHHQRGTEFNSNRSVSLIMRWGDKCWNAGDYPHPEMWCFTYSEYMETVKELKQIRPELEFVIVTSETREMVENVTAEYAEWMEENGMRFVINVGDVMHGSSTVDKFAVNDDVMEIMQSMLSTIRLQFGSEFYILSQRSFWNMGIYGMIEKLGCTELNKINDPEWNLKYGTKDSKQRQTIYVESSKSEARFAEWNAQLFKDLSDLHGGQDEFEEHGIVHKLSTKYL